MFRTSLIKKLMDIKKKNRKKISNKLKLRRNLNISSFFLFFSNSLTTNIGTINIGALIIRFNELIDPKIDKSEGIKSLADNIWNKNWNKLPILVRKKTKIFV